MWYKHQVLYMTKIKCDSVPPDRCTAHQPVWTQKDHWIQRRTRPSDDMTPESLWSASLSQSSSSGLGLYSDREEAKKVYSLCSSMGKNEKKEQARWSFWMLSYLVLFLIGLFDKRPGNLVKLPQGWNHPHCLRVSLLRWLQYKHRHTDIRHTMTSSRTHGAFTEYSIWVNDV